MPDAQERPRVVPEVVTVTDAEGNQTKMVRIGQSIQTKAQVEATVANLDKSLAEIASQKAKVEGKDAEAVAKVLGEHVARLDRLTERLGEGRKALADALAKMG